jgi:predicted O-linked N-acetylglucosamine transferase (SPINDLY family)
MGQAPAGETAGIIARLEQLRQAGDLSAAELECRRACNRFPSDADLRVVLALLLRQQGKAEAAMAELDSAIRCEPDHVGALRHRGMLHASLGRHREAIADLGRVARVLPAEASAQYDLGVAFDMAHDTASALAQYELALARDPGLFAARLNRGYALAALERLDQALQNNLDLAQRFPYVPEAHFNLAEVLIALHRPGEALAACDRALAIRPDYAKAHIDRALALAELGRTEEAQQSLDQARALDPAAVHNFNAGFAARIGGFFEQFDARSLYLHRLYQQQEECDWSRRHELIDNLERLILEGAASGHEVSDPHLPFRALAFPISREANRLLVRAVANRIRAGVTPFPRVIAPADRIRIGYVSPDFRVHPAAFLTRRLYGLHDRARFEVFAYSLVADDGSEVRRDIVAGADCFRDVSALNSVQIAEQIHRDGIHIAIDLSGYTNYTRSEIFAFEPAPIQVNYLGFPGSLGADFYHYAIVDEVICPPGEERWWTERLVYLPDTYYVTDNQTKVVPLAARRSDAGLPEAGFVFCCFNNAYKIGPEIFDVWMRILTRVPDSVIWLLATGKKIEANLRREAQARGVDGSRIVVAPFLPREIHLARYPLAGLFLDTLHYNAHTTAVDALWMGVPVLTCPGRTMPSRVAASLLSAAGLPELIVGDLKGYEETAVRLATHGSAALATLRARLARNRSTCALFDTETFVRHLEKAYELIWEREREGLPPEPIRVPRLERAVPLHRRWY